MIPGILTGESPPVKMKLKDATLIRKQQQNSFGITLKQL